MGDLFLYLEEPTSDPDGRLVRHSWRLLRRNPQPCHRCANTGLFQLRTAVCHLCGGSGVLDDDTHDRSDHRLYDLFGAADYDCIPQLPKYLLPASAPSAILQDPQYTYWYCSVPELVAGPRAADMPPSWDQPMYPADKIELVACFFDFDPATARAADGRRFLEKSGFWAWVVGTPNARLVWTFGPSDIDW